MRKLAIGGTGLAAVRSGRWGVALGVLVAAIGFTALTLEPVSAQKLPKGFEVVIEAGAADATGSCHGELYIGYNQREKIDNFQIDLGLGRHNLGRPTGRVILRIPITIGLGTIHYNVDAQLGGIFVAGAVSADFTCQ